MALKHRLPDKKTILISPLEWGLGHAARMIPIAAQLIERGHKVLFAAGEEHLNLIRNELPKCELIHFPGFNPRYSRWLPQYIAMILKIPTLIYHICREHIELKKLIKEYQIEIIISDNRFGLWNRQVTTVYITHMPRIPFPKALRFMEPLGIYLHRQIIKQYNWLLIPDMPTEPNLTGRLSHGIKLPSNTRYIGILSRFTPHNKPATKTHNLVILSGPEPQKEKLKQKLTAIFQNQPQTTIITGGKPGIGIKKEETGKTVYYNHLPTQEMYRAITESKTIVTRSGYTTIMELITIGCNALLIPTPGQTEQEYLAEHLSKQQLFYTVKQSRLNHQTPLPHSTAINTRSLVTQSATLLKTALDEILHTNIR